MTLACPCGAPFLVHGGGDAGCLYCHSCGTLVGRTDFASQEELDAWSTVATFRGGLLLQNVHPSSEAVELVYGSVRCSECGEAEGESYDWVRSRGLCHRCAHKRKMERRQRAALKSGLQIKARSRRSVK